MMPDHAQMVARAASLVPTLRARAAEAEQFRRLPDANVAEPRAAGLFKVLQPRRRGGFEMSLHTHIDTVAEIARGCGSTAWCMGMIHAHSWLVGSFPQEAQAECYGANPDAIVCAVITPRGKARAVAGGYRLDGFWPFASGCQHADWLLLGTEIADEGGTVLDAGEGAAAVRTQKYAGSFRRNPQTSQEAPMYTNILIPTDGSELAGKAVEHGIALAKRIGARVTALTVLLPFHVLTTDVRMIEDTPAQYKARMQHHAEQTLGAVARAALTAGVTCETVHVEHEHPYRAIIETAESKGCDLIVMASHGRRGISAVVLGSETVKVLTHCKIPVLVHR